MDPNNKSDHNQLRKKAEKILKNKLSKLNLPPNEADLLRLVHELEVHQIELELQNEELKLAREQAESIAHKYTSLYDFAPIGYFTLSKEGKILELNLIGSKMLGQERSYLMNKSFGRFILEEELHAFNQFLDSAFKSEVKNATDMMVKGIGNPPIYAQLTAIVDEENENNCLLTVMDISERKQARMELEEVVRQLHILNAQKDKFFSIIAHDLKNPFNAIIGYCELLMIEVAEKNYTPVEEYAGIILDSSVKAMDLLSNLMEWAQSQTGRIIFDPKPLVLNEVVTEVTDMFDQIAHQKNIKIKREISDDVEVLADRNMLSTVIRNLISNAVKFVKPGGEIFIYSEEDANSNIICVKDYGVGIAKHVLEKLFRIDTNYTSMGTNNEKGTGLGLILCKEFVERHGGEIWVETEKDLGSTFFVSLPR